VASKIDASEVKWMNLNNHPHSYGIFIAGNEMGAAGQSYLYCAAFGNGRFIVRGFGPGPFQAAKRDSLCVLDIGSSNHGGQLHSGFAVVAPPFAHTSRTSRPGAAGRADPTSTRRAGFLLAHRASQRVTAHCP
jgi:hypothetical protein